MIFEEWISAVEALLGTGSNQNAAIIVSLFITMMVYFIIEVAASGKGWAITGMIVGLFTSILFTALGWYPLWTGAMIGLILAILAAWFLSKGSGGST